MATVLIVDDDCDIVQLLVAVVSGEGHTALKAGDGQTALDLLRAESPDIMFLDWMLPGMDGLEVCRQARAFTHIPIIMLTARQEEVDKIVGLEVGADDYLIKPVTPEELRARLRAHLRRQIVWKDGTERDEGKIERGPLTLDPDRFEATLDGNPLQLTRLEFDLLYSLASNPGIVYTRERLLDLVWHDNEYIVARGIDVHISRIRSKIEQDPAHPDMVLTVHGVGYKFNSKL